MRDASNNSRWLSTQIDSAGLSTRSIKGIAFQFVRAIVVLLTTVILARLLKPEDFGVVATILPVVALAQMLKDFGITIAIIQSPDIKQEEISVYFWLQILVGVVLGGLLALSGPLLAEFFQDERMVAIAIPMGIILVLSMVGNVHNALLRRNLLFGRITIIEVASAVLGLVGGIVAAMVGMGFWALIVQQFILALVALSGYWLSCSWRPTKWSYDKSALNGLAFGGTMTVGKLFDYLRSNVDQILIRKFTDATQLGYYGRVQRVIMIPATQVMGPVMAVAMPMLSRKQEASDYHDYFENIFRFCVALAVPAGVFCYFFSESVVYMILGDQWLDAAPILKGLSIIAIFHPIGNCISVNLVVFRRLKIMMLMPLITAILAIIVYFIGIQDGVATLARYYGYLIACMMPIYIYLVVSSTPVSGMKLLKVGIPLFLMMGLAIIVTYYVSCLKMGGITPLVKGMLLFGVYGSCYSFCVLIFLGYWKRVNNLFKFMKQGGL